MNVSAVCVLVATLTIFTAGITSEVSAVGFTITMKTDNAVYDHASVITVTGNVEPVDPNGSDVTIIIVRAVPSGIAGIAQVSVNSDGDFSTTINTATGSMKYDTTYLIKAQYVDAETTVSIELTAADETYSSESVTATTVTPETETSLSELVGGGPIEYDLTCSATSPTFWPNADDSTLEIHMDATHDGTLTVTLHEEVIKPFFRAENRINTIKGHGIGLAIVTRILDWHIGKLVISNASALSGSKFTITLPFNH